MTSRDAAPAESARPESVMLCQRFERRMRQCGAFELRISTRVARRDHCELTEICAGSDQAIGKRERKNYPRGSRAERTRDTESAKTLMAALPPGEVAVSAAGEGPHDN